MALSKSSLAGATATAVPGDVTEANSSGTINKLERAKTRQLVDSDIFTSPNRRWDALAPLTAPPPVGVGAHCLTCRCDRRLLRFSTVIQDPPDGLVPNFDDQELGRFDGLGRGPAPPPVVSAELCCRLSGSVR